LLKEQMAALAADKRSRDTKHQGKKTRIAGSRDSDGASPTAATSSVGFYEKVGKDRHTMFQEAADEEARHRVVAKWEHGKLSMVIPRNTRFKQMLVENYEGIQLDRRTRIAPGTPVDLDWQGETSAIDAGRANKKTVIF